jgi:hypothetical protein
VLAKGRDERVATLADRDRSALVRKEYVGALSSAQDDSLATAVEVLGDQNIGC